MNVDVNGLQKQQEEANEWDTNRLKVAIQLILKEDLNNAVYRAKKPADAVAFTRKRFTECGIFNEPRYKITANRLIRKLEAAKTIDDAVLVLGDYLLK